MLEERTADDELLVGALLDERVTVVLVLRVGDAATLERVGVVVTLRVGDALVRVGVVAVDREALLVRFTPFTLRETVPIVLLIRLLLLELVRTALLPNVLSVARLLLLTLVVVPRLVPALSIVARTAVRRPCSKARAFVTPRDALRLAKPRSGCRVAKSFLRTRSRIAL